MSEPIAQALSAADEHSCQMQDGVDYQTLAEAALAPLEAKARKLRAERDAKLRADVLREAATVAEEFTERFAEMDDMKAAGIIGPNTMAAAISSELRRLAAEAQP